MRDVVDDDVAKPCCSPELRKSNVSILKNTMVCLVTFYGSYYSNSALMHGIFNVNSIFNGREPFNFSVMSNLDFSADHNESTAALFSMEASYIFTTLVATYHLKSKLWDYAITVTIIHVLLSSTVMLEFPTQWQWWTAIGIGTLWMITLGEGIAIFLRRRSKRRAISASSIPMSKRGEHDVDIPHE